MLTEFGLEVRKLRLENHMRLKEMAEKLEMTSAFLSAIETGRKPVPPGLPDKVIAMLGLDEVSAARVRRAAAKSVKSVRLDVSERDDEAQELAVAFARKFPSMDKHDVQYLLKVLGNTKTPNPRPAHPAKAKKK